MGDSIRFGGYQGEASVHTRAARAFAADARARAGIGIDVVADIGALGHKAADLPALIADGRLDLGYFNASYLAGQVRSLGVFDIPFAVTSRAEIYRQLAAGLGARIAADIAAVTPFRLLAVWDNGFRHLSNRLRPIRAPRDCAGMRLRVIDSALHREIFAALGFDPVTVDVRDLAAAVADGTVDAQENPLTNVVQFGIHYTHRHLSLTAHFFGVALVLANRAWFDGLDSATREAMTDALAVATATQREAAAAEDARCLALLRRDGVAVVETNDIDIAAFRARLAPIIERPRA
jgi:TRAP-type C4-dicarboxylate transport system substrate-binding protein